MEAERNTPKKATKASEQPHAADVALGKKLQPVAIYTLGPKGGVGKSTLARLTIDAFDAARLGVAIVQVDRSPALSSLYPDRTCTIHVPSAQDMREDPLAAVRVFEPWEAQVQTIAGRHSYLVTDVGGGQNARAFLDYIARTRVDALLRSAGVRALAFLLLTPEPAAMTLSADLADEFQKIHPHAEVIPVFNQRDGVFKFFPGSAAHKVYNERIVPRAKAGRHLVMPAIAAGAWPVFEAGGMTFLQVAMADENDLVKKLGLSRAMAAALQGDVSAFLAVMWPRLGSLIGFSMEALHDTA